MSILNASVEAAWVDLGQNLASYRHQRRLLASAFAVCLAATLLPVTINGFGVREGIFVGILAHTGVGAVAATAIAVFADLQILPVALIGGAVCLGWLGPGRRATTVTGLSRLSPRRDHC